jgi:hypothetical protein
MRLKVFGRQRRSSVLRRVRVRSAILSSVKSGRRKAAKIAILPGKCR